MFKTIHVSNILIPNKNIDRTAYSVIACDQFTSEVEYWDSLKSFVGDKPSVLNMILPEAYLKEVNNANCIKSINNTIDEYLKNDVLTDVGPCFVLVERDTSYGTKRVGLVLSIDLEDYSYEIGSNCCIRASEATIVERIAPRLEIRKDASIELPHTILLFNDDERHIIEPIFKSRKTLECLYDFELNSDGGRVRGYKVTNTNEIIEAFGQLFAKNNDGLMFVVGDGNHSLATAKAHWENVKQTLTSEEQKEHPARYALVEVCNIYDEGIKFEPIHRILFNCSSDVIEGLKTECSGDSTACYIYNNGVKTQLMTSENGAETYKTVQDYLDRFMLNHPETRIDFIHDVPALEKLSKKHRNSIGVIMPSLSKSGLFKFVSSGGVLPRKSFSMGHASEKRYYLEGKKIK